MESEKAIEQFSSFYKMGSLLVSDRLSSMLKVNMDLKDISCALEPYSAFCAQVPSFSFIGLYKYKTRGLLVFIDPKIVYILSNRFLGGPGIIEKKPAPLFTFSEELFGKELLSWITSIFSENNINIHFLRHESKINHVHYFFPDEVVATMVMKCRLNEKLIGNICICHPKLFVEQENLTCAAF